MALLDPADQSVRHDADRRDETTRHPMLCLAGGFGAIVGIALAVHLLFNALI